MSRAKKAGKRSEKYMGRLNEGFISMMDDDWTKFGESLRLRYNIVTVNASTGLSETPRNDTTENMVISGNGENESVFISQRAQ
jgi:hypothetical protein